MHAQKSIKVSRQGGFTLVELMVVITVIAVLSATCVLKLRGFIAKGKIAAGITAGRCIQNSFIASAATSLNNSLPIVTNYQEVAQVANTNGCPMPYEGNPNMVPPVSFIGYWCYEQDPLTGTIFIIPCDPGVPFDYHLELGVPGVADTKIEVDSLSGVRAAPAAAAFP